MGWSKLYAEIVTSSIWSADDKTRLVWVTLLALKDQNGFVPASIPGLANAARVSVEDCEMAVNLLESPDKYSRTPDHEGRRIAKVDGGWTILNHFKYRDGLTDEPTAAAARERMRRMREKRRQEEEKKEQKADTDTYTDTGLRNVTPPLRNKTECKTSKSFTIPTIEEARIYAESIQLHVTEADAFVDHFTANGWKVGGKTAMKDWRASMRTWKRNNSPGGQFFKSASNRTPVKPAASIDYSKGF